MPVDRLFSLLRSFVIWNPRTAWHMRNSLHWFTGLRFAPAACSSAERRRQLQQRRQHQLLGERERRRTIWRKAAICLVVCAWLIAVGATWASAQEAAKPAGGNKSQDAKPALNAADERFFEEKIRPLLANRCYSCHGPDEQESGLRLDTRDHLLKGGYSGPAAVAGKENESLLLKVVAYDGDIKMPPSGKMPDEEIAALREWVRRGLPWPAGVDLKPVDSIQAARQSHWAYQPLNPQLPAEANKRLAADEASNKFNWSAWIQTPIDRYVAASLAEAGLTPSARADRRTLLRRLSFDLIGLPPTPEEIDAFLRDPAPDETAIATQIDRLLSSPHYGVRWGRHWLDVARYADTKGYVLQGEKQFPYSYTYRDYVIESFNNDLPYDQFVREQLAADFYPRPDGDNRSLAALGFLTVGRRFLNGHDLIDDRIDVVTRGLLGLTVTCARCHDHKYDPIPTADYYALYGVFNSCYEPEDLPLIGTPDDTPAYREFMEEQARRQKVLDDYLAGVVEKMVQDFRSQADLYFLEAVAPEVKGQHTSRNTKPAGDLKPPMVNRWRSFAQNQARNHAWFSAWGQLAGVPKEQFAKRLESYLESPPKDTPELLLERLREKMPSNRNELALVYAQLLTEAASTLPQPQVETKDAKDKKDAKEGEAQEAAPAPLAPAVAEKVASLAQWLQQDGAPCNITVAEADPYYDRVARNKRTELRRAIENHRVTHPAAPPRAMVLVDKAQPVEPRIFVRGNPARQGDRVPRRFLTVLASDGEPQPFKQGSGRAELAAAVTSPDNPVFARVIVNRVWMHHFGEGLVRTTSDFGSRSEPPSHPRLLDYLAQRLIDSGWSLKTLHREILLSAVWQQKSELRPECRSVDPENRLLWKANRRRLEYEPLRDAMLAVSGKLDKQIGGRPVQLFKPPYTTRRTVYGLIDRQELPSVFRVFDIASPDASSPNRPETIVAQQALYLMNAPFVMEQAQALAEASARRAEEVLRAVADNGGSATPAGAVSTAAAADATLVRLSELYRLAFGREPDATEQGLALNYLKAGASGKLDAWAKLAHALLCSNEFVFVD